MGRRQGLCKEEGKKEKCWCEYDKNSRNNWNVSVKDREGIPSRVWEVEYCPVCGKKMEE